jgi:hypothetical protein
MRAKLAIIALSLVAMPTIGSSEALAGPPGEKNRIYRSTSPDWGANTSGRIWWGCERFSCHARVEGRVWNKNGGRTCSFAKVRIAHRGKKRFRPSRIVCAANGTADYHASWRAEGPWALHVAACS